ncbi:MAG: hypothetical protein EZS28_014827 [Streblomastix strix]|uniref:Uncharacterized protein n=1 Tax=Streblomastix strix TaxID=222440 RepID=A0A5J4W4V7_9EUKA|nr:MAG: hypothetical protein EZS28_014827 [Streblomastix strix]
MITIQTNQIRVHKSKHASVVKKELSEQDKARLQAIDETITNGFRKAVQIPQLQIQSSIQTPLRSRDLNIDEDEPQREIQTERPRRHRYNINKYKEVPRETAQVEPEQVVKDKYLSHSNLEVQKFIIDTKEIVRVDDVLIKNVSISNLDNVLWNSFEKLYRVNKDFIRLSDKLESDIGPEDF